MGFLFWKKKEKREKREIIMNKRNYNVLRILYSCLLIFGISFLAGCGADNTAKDSTESSASNQATETNKSSENHFPFTYTDATDTEITIEKKPERIVSLIPSNTEIAFALGLDDEIIGVSDFDNFPQEAENKEKIGGLDFNVEKVLSLKPDLVLAESSMMGMSGERFKQLRDAGIPVAVVPSSNSFAETYETIKLISQLTGTEEQADVIIEQMKSKVDEVKAKVSELENPDQPSVLVEIDSELWTVGKGTFMNEMLEMLGAKNIADQKEGAYQIGEEEVIPLNPDVIIVTYGYYIENPTEEVLKRKGWEGITAVKENKVYEVNSDIVNRPGPRLAEGLEEFAKAIYPEAFSK